MTETDSLTPTQTIDVSHQLPATIDLVGPEPVIDLREPQTELSLDPRDHSYDPHDITDLNLHTIREYMEHLSDTERDKQLRRYLGPDYKIAKESGLIDMFYYNPEEGRDGLMHTLVGEFIHGPNGSVEEVAGAHHRASFRDPNTYVDFSHITNAKQRNRYAELQWQPWKSRSVIKSYPKQVIRMGEDNKPTVELKDSGMFPDEYDPLAVMQAISIARGPGRDKSQDKILDDGTILAIGQAPLLDGERSMSIRMFLMPGTEQVISAFPNDRGVGRVVLSREAIKQYLGVGQ